MTPWTKSEPGWRAFATELSRLHRRSRSYLWRALLIALLITGAVAFKMIRKPQLFRGAIVISMTEGLIQDETTPVPKNELRTYVSDAALNRRHVLNLIEEKGLYPRALNDDMALDAFWDDLEIEVYQNQFAVETDGPIRRSARVSFSYRSPDPELTMDVLRTIQGIIFDFDAVRRREQAAQTAQDLRDAVRAAEESLDERAAKLALKNTELILADPGKRAWLEMEVGELVKRIEQGKLQLKTLNQAVSAADLRRSIEDEKRGLLLSVVDVRTPDPHNPKPLRIALVAFVVFLFALPLAGLGAASLDARVYDAGDVQRLGVPVIGQLAKFRGSGVGSLSARK